MSTNPDRLEADTDTTPGLALADAERLVAEGRLLDAVDLLSAANRELGDADVECRLVELRYQAFSNLDPDAGFERWPVPVADLDPGPASVPEITLDELDAEVVRRNIRSHGSVLVRGLLDDDQITLLHEGIERALAIRADQARKGGPIEAPQDPSWFHAMPLPAEQRQSLGRNWIAGAGGLLTCDSPKVLDQLLTTYEEIGLRKVLADYLGERPILSANKCTLRRVPLTASTDWHQDGAFLGNDIRALNVWVALTDCGTDSPGMDVLPRRFEHIVETGTGGSIFDWAVGPAVVEQLAEHAPVVRPQFRAGDALLFDDLFLHRTAIEPTMTVPRFAIEAWFFAASDYPPGQVPLVW